MLFFYLLLLLISVVCGPNIKEIYKKKDRNCPQSNHYENDFLLFCFSFLSFFLSYSISLSHIIPFFDFINLSYCLLSLSYDKLNIFPALLLRLEQKNPSSYFDIFNVVILAFIVIVTIYIKSKTGCRFSMWFRNH